MIAIVTAPELRANLGGVTVAVPSKSGICPGSKLSRSRITAGIVTCPFKYGSVLDYVILSPSPPWALPGQQMIHRPRSAAQTSPRRNRHLTRV